MTSSLGGISRRRFLGLLAGTAGGLATGAQARSRQPITVLTAYPPEVLARFETAFEKAHPQYRLEIVWRMPHDALPYLRQPAQSGVDVYWSASPRTYETLAKEELLRPLKLDFTGLPDRIGQVPLRDPGGRYTATEMAGFGFAVNTAALAERNLPIPGDWDELAHPRYQGLIALPSPAKVGFAPPMLEIVLQAWGWEKGWALWSEIAGNASLIERGSTFVSDEVVSGRKPIGLSIDFFVASSIANGAPIQFTYPRHGGINPAHIGITRNAPNLAGAEAFTRFVLSTAGQTLLTDPDIRKLPVRPAVYAKLPNTQFKPFALAAAGGFDYDSERGIARQGLSTALFDTVLAKGQNDLASLWKRLHQAEARGIVPGKAREALTRAPLSEEEANDPALRASFRKRLEGSEETTITANESAWTSYGEFQRAVARGELERAGA